MKDFLLDPETGDLQTNAGDFVTGVSDQQQQMLLLKLPKGSIKNNPVATVGVMGYLEHEDGAALLREIRNKFTADGMAIKSLGFSENGDQLKIDAPYK